MAEDKQIISVFGSMEDVSAKLKSQELSDVTVHSALELILSGSVGLEINEDNTYALSRDMCFLSVSRDLTEASISTLLADASLTAAPLSVQIQDDTTGSAMGIDMGADTEDLTEDDPLVGLAQDMKANSLGDNLARLQDTVARIREYTMMAPQSDKQINPSMATILHSESPLGSMLPEGTSSGFLFCQLASINHGQDGSTVEYDVEAPVLISGVIRKLDIDDEEGSLSVDPEGDDLFVSDRSLSYIVESGTPSIITLITPKNEDLVEVRTWFVYLDSVDGMSPAVSTEVMKSVGAEINAEGVTIEHVWPADIALNPLHFSPAMFKQEDIVTIAEELIYEGEDEDED